MILFQEVRTRAYTAVTTGGALLLLAPSSASALTFVQVVGLFHIAVGLLLTFTLLIFAAGVSIYVARLNTWPSFRETAIRVMEWAIVMLFMLIILIAIVNFFQRHSSIALPLLAFVIILIVAVFIVRMAAQNSKKPAKPASPERK